MSDSIASLRAGVSELLDLDGEPELADIVRRSAVELRAGEVWQMGARSVVAQRVCLALDALDYLAISAIDAGVEKVRAAFSQAMRSPDTELAELFVVLKLPPAGRAWHEVYRDAPVSHRSERPSPEQVLFAARAFLEAEGDAEAASVLGRAELEVAPAPSSDPPVARYVVKLSPDDSQAREAAMADRLERAVRLAGARPEERVASVEFGMRKTRGRER